jgi:hypothetical protein
MLTSLDKWAERDPGLANIQVECRCLDWRSLKAHVSCQVAGSEGGTTILATDNLSLDGVRELCEAEWVCSNCRGVYEFCERYDEDLVVCDGCGEPYAQPVTARLALWRGQEVEDWRGILWTGGKIRENTPDGPAEYDEWPHPLTAVILLATDPIPVERVREARDACAEAGVQFVIASFDYAFTKAEFGGVLRHDGQTLDGRDLSRLELP